jgi:CNT family concentrative nucleoside transporter
MEFLQSRIDSMGAVRGLIGIGALLAVAWALSQHRRRFPLRTVVGGIALQWALALVVLKSETGRAVFDGLGKAVTVVLACTMDGARFVLGNLVESRTDQWGVVFAATALPSIIVFSSLSAIGYHLGILQIVVGVMAWVMKRLLGVSGAESLSTAGNVFLGQTEAPLLVRPYIASMTESELMALMTGGFATIAGGVMAVYVAVLGGDDPVRRIEVARHLLTASLMSAPASFVIAKVMIPETGVPATADFVRLQVERETRNVIHAAAAGAADGLKLALNVGAMLIAFIALIALLNRSLVFLGGLSPIAPMVSWAGLDELTLGGVLGLVFSPMAYAIGVAPAECRAFGGLLGTAMATNEFVAYLSLADLTGRHVISERTATLAMYSLCGFANFSSIAIQIGGIGGMAPERRGDLARLGLRAMLGGAMACWMTGCIAGALT